MILFRLCVFARAYVSAKKIGATEVAPIGRIMFCVNYM